MIAVSKQKKTSINESAHVLEMKQKIKDELYINCAVHRIALVLSRKLVENNESGRK